jgi:hypothetical protein
MLASMLESRDAVACDRLCRYLVPFRLNDCTMVPRSVGGKQVAGTGWFLLIDKMGLLARRHQTRWAKTLLLVASIGVHGCLDFRVLRMWLSLPSDGMTLVTGTRRCRRCNHTVAYHICRSYQRMII